MDSIAHYKILERVGESRLGEVFRARDTRLGRTVAINVPPDSVQHDPAQRDALLADARAAMALSHPNIAAVYEAGDDNGRAFLAREFVPGDALDRVIAGHALNPRRAIDVATQIADALADAHAAGMAHGHLTADAVVVTPKGSAKILDFGFAKWIRADGGSGDEAGDIRALGRLFFEMLTGKAPSDERVAPTTLNKALPGEVDAIALKALPAGSHLCGGAAGGGRDSRGSGRDGGQVAGDSRQRQSLAIERPLDRGGARDSRGRARGRVVVGRCAAAGSSRPFPPAARAAAS